MYNSCNLVEIERVFLFKGQKKTPKMEEQKLPDTDLRLQIAAGVYTFCYNDD